MSNWVKILIYNKGYFKKSFFKNEGYFFQCEKTTPVNKMNNIHRKKFFFLMLASEVSRKDKNK